MRNGHNIHRLCSWLRYFLFSRHASGHGIHSPFVYDFIINVLRNKQFPVELELIEGIRSSLLLSNEYIWMNDLGSGRRGQEPQQKSVTRITKNASTRKKFGRLLFKIMEYHQPEKVLELGTSMGIGSMYLGMGNPDAKVITIEGCEECAGMARKNLTHLGVTNVSVLNGAFEDVLPLILKEMEWVDLIFFDGDHRKVPTLDYFETILPYVQNDSILIFDDIHWSAEMEDAWGIIKRHPQTKVTIELYQFGIVFFRKELQKQDFLVRFL